MRKLDRSAERAFSGSGFPAIRFVLFGSILGAPGRSVAGDVCGDAHTDRRPHEQRTIFVAYCMEERMGAARALRPTQIAD